MFISILGRQAGISLAELEVLFGADKITKISDKAALVDEATPDVNKLGGSIKIIDNVHKLEVKDWRSASNEVTKYLKNHARNHGDGKMTIGLSVYGDNSLKPNQLQKYLIITKKEMRSNGFSVRVIPNKNVELNSAQVLHNKLTAEKNAEVVLVKSDNEYWIGRTVGVQNIEALARRDQGRPKRDARVGMLPPKLALIMLNLGVGELEPRGKSLELGGEGLQLRDESLELRGKKFMVRSPSSQVQASSLQAPVDLSKTVSGFDEHKEEAGNEDSPSQLPAPNSQLPTILDPFCGTGVILQEALIRGYATYGTDLEPRMIAYSQENLDWLKENFNQFTNSKLQAPSSRLEVGDAQYHKWSKPFDTVVCETYLGPPMSSAPAPDKLAVVHSEVNSLLKTFLRNIHKQLEEGSSLCLAVPAWRVGGKILHLNLLDDLEKLGYTRLVLKHATYSDLVYFRPNQTVTREILILERN